MLALPDANRSQLSRRAILTGIAGAAMARCLPAGAAPLRAIPIASLTPPASTTLASTIIVGGGPGSGPARWAPVLTSLLAGSLQGGEPIGLHPVAGWDGVTAANLFDEQIPGESASALLVPGAAIMASLIGDQRVHFESQRWLPVFVSLGAPLVMGRVDLRRSLRTILRDRPVRIALSSVGVELPTIMAMTMLSMRPVLMGGFGSPAAAIQAAQAGQVDVVQLPGADDAGTRQAQVDTLQAAGFEPLFTLAPPGIALADPAQAAQVPDFTTRYLSARGKMPSNALYPAWCAVAAASCLDTGLMLPMLTPPAQTALWRHACNVAVTDGQMKAIAGQTGAQMVSGDDCAAVYSKMRPDVSTVLALRRWYAENSPRWHIG